jgi:phosphatidylinositol kinase/protein kinase (PI-3  family)
LIEYIENSQSISSLKKIYQTQSLKQIYLKKFPYEKQNQVTKEFIRSLAGYSFLSFILQVKDRHNDNILIDQHGRCIHIDFGYCLTQTPLYIKLEYAPFKFTEDYLEMLDGLNSANFVYFKDLLVGAF